MARLARVVLPGVPHHVTQRGVRSMEIFSSDEDRGEYLSKIVEWSEEDQCFIGQCPGIIGPCCHGDNEIEVYKELCLIVEEWLEISKKENKALPSPTIGKGIAEQLATIA